MANTDIPSGFKYVRNLDGSQSASTILYQIYSDNSTTIGKGDPIYAKSDGYYGRSAAGSGVVNVAIAAALYDSNMKPLSYLPALTAGYVAGIPIKNNIFEVQCDSGTTVTVADRNATADLTVGNCNTDTGNSIYELDSSNIGTGNSVRIIDKADRADNAWGEHVKVLVAFVENAYTDTTTI
jgi:hypothetical protein